MERIASIASHLTSSATGFAKKPVRVTITGAAGNIGYALAFMIGGGRLLGADQPIDLVLLEIPPAANALKAVVMELNDAAFPLVNSVTATTDQATGFKDTQIALLVGAKPRGKGMDRKDLLQQNGAIFRSQARVIQENAHPDVKICVVGNPANTNAAIIAEYATGIHPKNITSLTRLDMNRAKAQISEKLNIHSSSIRNLVIWGNHSKTQFPDIKNAEILAADGTKKRVADHITDREWLAKTFIPTVQTRGKAIIDARGLSSAASAASSVCDHVFSWINGTPEGEYVSMGVMSDGSYGVPVGINFSFPVTCKAGNWTIVQGLDLTDEFSRTRFQATLDELKTEKDTALTYLRAN